MAVDAASLTAQSCLLQLLRARTFSRSSRGAHRGAEPRKVGASGAGRSIATQHTGLVSFRFSALDSCENGTGPTAPCPATSASCYTGRVQTAQPAPITHQVRTQSRLPDVTQPPPNQHGAAFVPLESEQASRVKAFFRNNGPKMPLSGRLALDFGVRSYDTLLRWTRDAISTYESD